MPLNRFLIIAAVVMSEVSKLITCLGIVYHEEGSLSRAINAVQNTVIRNPIDTLKVCVPSFVYIVQNNLLYVSASHLDAATYQVRNPKKKIKKLLVSFFGVLL